MIEFDSASAMVGGTATGRHLLHIEGYSHTKPLLNQHFDSQPFVVGGRTWRVRYHPDGIFREGDAFVDHVAFVVILDDTLLEPAVAETRFLLLDRDGNEMPAHTQSADVHEFVNGGEGKTFSVKREIVGAPECLADDCFKVRVDISVSTGFRCENRETKPPSDLDQHLGNLLVTGDGADVTFQVADEMFRAHRCVLAARSPVFKAELYRLFGAMRGSATTAPEVCTRIHDVAPQVFRALLHFVYTDSLPPDMTGCLAEEQVVTVQRLLEAADRYDMPRLKLTCEDKLCRCLDSRMVASTLVLAYQRRCHRLKKACIEFLRCPHALNAAMATDGFERIRSNPRLLNELISKVTVPCDL